MVWVSKGRLFSFGFVAQPILAVLFRATLAQKVSSKNRTEAHGHGAAPACLLPSEGGSQMALRDKDCHPEGVTRPKDLSS
jgi:hypothetical protein